MFCRDRHVFAHAAVRRDGDVVHLATVHVVQCAEVVSGGAAGCEALVRFRSHSVVIGTGRLVPLDLTDSQAVQTGDVLRDAWFCDRE